jgi:hypothetical protein
MESLNYKKMVQDLLEYYVSLGQQFRKEENQAFVLVDATQTHFQWIRLGWKDQRRVYGCIMHFEVKNGKIWVHQDGTDLDPVGALLEQGVPQSDIVLAFHPPSARHLTGFAVG